jgi:hypothetical protein
MSKCIDCIWFPWKSGIDLSMLPAMKCHPEKPMKRWSEQAASAEHDCKFYEESELDEDEQPSGSGVESPGAGEKDLKEDEVKNPPAQVEPEGEKQPAKGEETKTEGKAPEENGAQTPPAQVEPEGEKQVVMKDGTDTGTEDKTKETNKRKNS